MFVLWLPWALLHNCQWLLVKLGIWNFCWDFKLGCESLGERWTELRGDLFPCYLGSYLEPQNLPNHRVVSVMDFFDVILDMVHHEMQFRTKMVQKLAISSTFWDQKVVRIIFPENSIIKPWEAWRYFTIQFSWEGFWDPFNFQRPEEFVEVYKNQVSWHIWGVPLRRNGDLVGGIKWSSEESAWDAMATCFFLDTAKNVSLGFWNWKSFLP